MRLARVATGDGTEIWAGRGEAWVPVPDVDGADEHAGLVELLQDPERARLETLLDASPESGSRGPDLCAALTVCDVGDIWGAGLNYRSHSADLDAAQPTSGPGSYLRPRTCLIGNGGRIELPAQSRRVTAEAELALVIGRTCKNVPTADWRSVVAAVTAALDLTAEDAIRENPRHIPWAKGFDTFCSIGPQLVSLDEFDTGDLQQVTISTVHNGAAVATAPVRDMKYDLGQLVAYFSAGRTLTAGTVICTGTPGAAAISSGDSISAVVEGIGTLTHHVS